MTCRVCGWFIQEGYAVREGRLGAAVIPCHIHTATPNTIVRFAETILRVHNAYIYGNDGDGI